MTTLEQVYSEIKEVVYVKQKIIKIQDFKFMLAFTRLPNNHPKIVLKLLNFQMTLAYPNSKNIASLEFKNDISYQGNLNGIFEIFVYNNHGVFITLKNLRNQKIITELILNPIEEQKVLRDFKEYIKVSK